MYFHPKRPQWLLHEAADTQRIPTSPGSRIRLGLPSIRTAGYVDAIAHRASKEIAESVVESPTAIATAPMLIAVMVLSQKNESC